MQDEAASPTACRELMRSSGVDENWRPGQSQGLLERLTIQNFRGFDDHAVPFRDLTVLVGANNAGKSTVVEALRLVASVVTRIRRGTGQFTAVPDWLEHPMAYRGVQPARRGRSFEGHGASTFHRYNPPPAVLRADFTGGASIIVFVGPEGEIHGVVRDADGHALGTAAEARGLELSPLAIQPQVAPLQREERTLVEETVRRGEGTYLAPQHFRNQLVLFSADRPRFREMAEETWPGLQITRLDHDLYHPEEPIQLHIRDNDFVGEVSLMGHGLQMWLQTIWFLARTERDATVVLDEPDVYMHPDLQRRLLELVRDRFEQLVVATHSIEIVSDVDPRSILSIDRRQPESSFMTDFPGVQDVIDSLGGVHNIQVTRLFGSKSFFLVEGQDVKLLRILQQAVSPTATPIDLIPHGELGGRGGWSSGLPAKLPTKNAAGDRITSYAILDRDYFPQDEIDERYREAQRWRVNLRVWSRKELENYLLVPETISRFIDDNARAGFAAAPDHNTIADKIDSIVEGMRLTPITDSFATEILNRNKRRGLPNANREARTLVTAAWTTRESRWALAPGKDVLAALSDWSKAEFGVSFGPEQIARVMTGDELNREVVEVLEAIPVGRRLRKPRA